MLKSVSYIVRPSSVRPSKVRRLPYQDVYDFDLDQVELAAMAETLQTTLAANPFSTFVRGFLAPYTDRLIWMGEGPGIGREMRRAFSAIFSRFFARAYLTDCHGFIWFAPLDDRQQVVSRGLRVASPGPRQDLPDWICGTQNQLVLAEAKGSRGQSRLTYLSQPSQIKQAVKQLETCRVSVLDTATGRWIDRKLKGWAVLNQWSFQLSNADPYLFVVDPETHGESLNRDDLPALLRAVARKHVGGLLRGLELTHLANEILLYEGGSSFAEFTAGTSEFSAAPVAVSIPSLGAATATGRLFASSPRYSTSGTIDNELFVGVQTEILDDLRHASGVAPTALEPLTLPMEGVLRGADGLIVARQSSVTILGEG